ncbi:Bypass of stop codon protein 6 [Psilocybe cubensis]|uniref:Bypass of stop codon protein 6 n=1 Tax=Psilocybe cubensis TaxID=181762 RepID=A0ACB8HGR6_PSICU|nr:Bypass of stop codon protein 6 [Psilocybe cubensis]KAH9487131.1 Bypass of stop codon protein 6 [Psilocybe cubensis]
MSLRNLQSSLSKNQENIHTNRSYVSNDDELQTSPPPSIDSLAPTFAPEPPCLPYTHSKEDLRNSPSPSSSKPCTIVDNGKISITTDSSEGNSSSPPDRLKWRLASGFFAYFMCGWGDGDFMADYHITFMMSSLLYAATTVGFIVGTMLVESIINQLGRFRLVADHSSWIPAIQLLKTKQSDNEIGYSPSQARHISLLVSSILHGMFFVMMGSRGGFWAAFGAYAVAAFARSVLTASLNGYFAEGPKQSLGYAFGLWSLGSVASPLLCQSLIAVNVPWFNFYLGSLVLSAVNVVFLVTTFKPTLREHLHDRQNAIMLAAKCDNKDTWVANKNKEHFTSESRSENVASNKKGTNPTLSSALKMKFQWAICLFSLLYYGCETSTSGFIVSYLLDIRNANPKTVGYVSSGFWGGITIGRFVWGHVTPNIIGLVYGPVFPASLTLANDILPLEVRIISMALISAAASLGSALFPFVAGTILSIQGIHTLTYFTVPLAGALTFLWALFPSKPPSRPETSV